MNASEYIESCHEDQLSRLVAEQLLGWKPIFWVRKDRPDDTVSSGTSHWLIPQGNLKKSHLGETRELPAYSIAETRDLPPVNRDETLSIVWTVLEEGNMVGGVLSNLRYLTRSGDPFAWLKADKVLKVRAALLAHWNIARTRPENTKRCECGERVYPINQFPGEDELCLTCENARINYEATQKMEAEKQEAGYSQVRQEEEGSGDPDDFPF